MKQNILNWTTGEINGLITQATMYHLVNENPSIEWEFIDIDGAIYFVGRTLFIDIKINGDIIDCMTFNHSEESVGFFSGGLRKLMSIKQLRCMEYLMLKNNISHTPKWDKRLMYDHKV